jgi:hypothetical protein
VPLWLLSRLNTADAVHSVFYEHVMSYVFSSLSVAALIYLFVHFCLQAIGPQISQAAVSSDTPSSS